MAITVSEFTPQVTEGGTSLGATKTCTAGSAIIVVGSSTEAGAALTCSGYTERQAISHGSSGIKTFVWTADNIAGGSTTVTMGGLAGYKGTLQVFEVLGVDAAAYEASGSITQSVTGVYHAGAAGVDVSSNGLALACLIADRDITTLAVSGYTSGTNANNSSSYAYSRYQVFASGATDERAAGTLTTNGHTTGILVALKAGASGPTITGPSGAAGAGTSTANIAENATTGPTFSTDIALGGGYPSLTGAQAANWSITALTATSWRIDPVTPFDFEAGGLVNPQTVVFNADAATSQTCTVTITNASEPPLAPTIGTATAGNASASVAFTPPTNTGRPAISGYTATSSPGGLTGTGASSPITVSGLTNGTAYTFTVTATNADGAGPASAASNSVTPSAGGSSPAPRRSFPLSILNH